MGFAQTGMSVLLLSGMFSYPKRCESSLAINLSKCLCRLPLTLVPLSPSQPGI